MDRRISIPLALVSVSMMILMALPGIHVAHAQTFNRVGGLTLNSGEMNLASSVIDTAAGFAYFGTDTSPGVIVKVRLSDLTRVGSLVLNSGQGQLESAVIDPVGGFAYFGTRTSPGVVVKIRLSDFSVAGSLTLKPVESYLVSAIIDPQAGFAYFGTDTSPGIVAKIRLSDFVEVGYLTLNQGEDYLSNSIIDTVHGFAYFSTESGLVKIRLADFTLLASMVLSISKPVMVDSAGSYGYFGTGPGVAKVRLTDLVQVGTVNAAINIRVTSAVIDSAAGLAYFGDPTGFVSRVRLWDMTQIGYIGLGSGENNLSTSVIDPVSGFAYFGTFSSPGIVVKLDVAAPPASDYSLSNRGGITVLRGSSGTTTIATAQSRGAAENVSLSCDPYTLPAGVSCSFGPSPLTPNGSSTVTVFTTSATPTGSFQVQVVSNPLGTTTVPTVFTLTVNPTILGFDPIVFYGLVGVVIVGGIVGVMLVRRKHGSFPFKSGGL